MIAERYITNGASSFRYDSGLAPIEPMRLEIEVNTYEHFSVLGYVSPPFEMQSSWFSGSCKLKLRNREYYFCAITSMSPSRI